MTRDDHRKACLEAMEVAYWELWKQNDHVRVRDLLTAAFDALPTAEARVVPVDATKGMGNAPDARWFPIAMEDIQEVFDIMSAAGDLTNPPEGNFDLGDEVGKLNP